MVQPTTTHPDRGTDGGTQAGVRPPMPRRTATTSAIVLGVAGAVVLATSGSPLWAVARVLVALAVAGAVVVAQRGGARAAGWSAVGVGAVALPAAGVMAADHLIAGTLVRGVAATLAASAAAVLLACGTGSLLRATRRWWRLLALPVALALVQLVMVPVGMGVLSTNRAHPALGGATPADHGLAYDEVALRTDDGVDLAAWYVPGENGAAVVLLHGAGSTRTSTLDHAEVLAGLGYGVLMVDSRGHGDSAGTGMDLGWYGNLDVDCAVDWLLTQPDVTIDRVGVVGLSMGAEEALTAAAADPRIGAVVAEGVGVRVADDAVPEGWLPDLVNRLTTTVTDVLTAADQPLPMREVVAALEPDQRALLIAGTGEGAQAAWYLEAAADGVSVWDVPDAGHMQALDVHPDEWTNRVGEVLDGALLGPVGDAG